MSSLTHLRRQRKERGCHWDNTRRNKVMFRGKHSLGIVLYLCSLTEFLFFLFPFLLFKHISSLFPSIVCLCFVCLMTHLFFVFPVSFCTSNGNFSFRKQKLKLTRLVRYSMCSACAGAFVSFKCFVGESVFIVIFPV